MGTRMREMGRTAVHDGNKTGNRHKMVDPLKVFSFLLTQT